MLEINILSSMLLVFVFFLLFFRKNNSLSNKILAFVFLLPGINFIVNILILTNLIDYIPWIFFLFQITASMFGPVTYYYINSLTAHKTTMTDKVLFGFSILIILVIIYVGVSFYLLDGTARFEYLEGLKHGPYPNDMEYCSTAIFIHQLVYFTFNLVRVRKYRLKMERQTSSLSKVKVFFLYRFAILLWLLTLITVALYIIVDEIIYVEYINLPVVVIIIFLFILYYAFHEHAIFTLKEYEHHKEMVSLPFSEIATTEAPVKQNIEAQLLLFKQIKDTLYKNEHYKSPEIDIQILAESIDKPVYIIADAIKRGDTTFYELIRRIRIEKAKEMLLDENCNFSVDGIGKEVGFSARSSFYRAFKKYENVNPTALKSQNVNP